MATLKSKKLQEALKKARNVGRAEEAVTVDGCSLVLRSLSPKDYEDIVSETTELEGIEYYQSYQMGHVCRSIVEIENVDLRDVDFIEDDVPSGHYILNAACSKAKAEEAKDTLAKMGITLSVVPPDGSEERTVLVERHEWVRQRISTWSREAVGVLYHKFADVVTEGARRARDKVDFHTQDETDEDKFRRLLGELKELSAQIPAELTQRIMEDAGYMPKSTPAELEEIAKRAREFAIEQAKLKEEVTQPQAPSPTTASAPVRVDPPSREVEPPPLPQEPASSPQDLQQELMERLRNRVPLNRTAVQGPVPTAVAGTEVAQRLDLASLDGVGAHAGVPPQIRSAMAESRSQQIAVLESSPHLGAPAEPQVFHATQREVPELSRNIPQLDGKSVKTILDKPPIVGINPRFRRPT